MSEQPPVISNVVEREPSSEEDALLEEDPLVEEDLLVEDISIDGMCGVY